MHDDQIKDTFKQEEKRRGAPDSNMSYDEQNDNPMKPNEESPKNTPDSVLKPKENIVLEEDNLDHILHAEPEDIINEEANKEAVNEELDHE